MLRGRPLIRTVFSICTACKSGWVGLFEIIGHANKKSEKIRTPLKHIFLFYICFISNTNHLTDST